MVRITFNDLTDELTPEEMTELEKASMRPIQFDDDSPEMTVPR